MVVALSSHHPIRCLLVLPFDGGRMKMAGIPWFLPTMELGAIVPPLAGPWKILFLRSFLATASAEVSASGVLCLFLFV
jgi:hypothetical protein